MSKELSDFTVSAGGLQSNRISSFFIGGPVCMIDLWSSDSIRKIKSMHWNKEHNLFFNIQCFLLLKKVRGVSKVHTQYIIHQK